MLKLSGRAYDSALSVTLDYLRIPAQHTHQRARHFEAQGLEVIHKTGDLLHIRASERIADNSKNSCPSKRNGRAWPSLVENLLHRREFLPNINLRHE